MHEGQLSVRVQMVRDLIADQFPRWAPLPIAPVRSEGTVNAIFRIGDGLAARFPLQPGDAEATERELHAEAEAARELRDHTTFRVPEPLAVGAPGAGFPLPWLVQTWVPGTTASRRDPSASREFAHDLAEFIGQVRAIDVRGRRFNRSGRGGELRPHDEYVQTCFARSEQLLDVPRLRRLWMRFRGLPRRAPDAMTHGDLIPGNVLVADGRLVGVLDTGGLGPADPALDLVSAWHLLDAGPRRLLRDILGCNELEWERGKAWAFEQAMGATWYYLETNPSMNRMGRRTLDRILADERSSGPPGASTGLEARNQGVDKNPPEEGNHT